ncbi:putative fatty acyl-CoA reductase [Fragariocoptes setiger]|uniref:Fatty acyl-CoA reductase n=1 Tax=Fragariocoptes setiger TaxID=1670756 RepID=A0ABQ7S7U0_9ACAR|nr:putative fatty acyl-CoA reductase [Fragariocoptes setiger]
MDSRANHEAAMCRTNNSNSNDSNNKHERSVRNDSDVVSEMIACMKSETIDYHTNSKIAQFYAGRSIFITGASGFIGKCVVEKFLRSCPDITNIYILLRPKRGKTVEERLKNLLDSELFDKVRSKHDGKQQLAKVKPIAGDITWPRFGLSDTALDTLRDSVTLVFHSAATVKFNEPMKQAIENNLMSVQYLTDLLAEFRHLKALVHVSTAYANCDRDSLDELFYEPPVDPYKLLDLAEWMDPETLEKITPTLLGKRPNTYTFTKSVAEALLADQVKRRLGHVATAIVRPSIVAGVWREPIRGWVDNFNGPTGVILSMATGCLQAVRANGKLNTDIVPVDVVSNLIITCGWYLLCERHRSVDLTAVSSTAKQIDVIKDSRDLESIRREIANNDAIIRHNQIEIFHCVTSSRNPVSWTQFAEKIFETTKRYPCKDMLRTPGQLMFSNYYLHKVYDYFNHYCVAQLIDVGAKLSGHKPRMVNIYGRMSRMVTILTPFTTNQWLFNCNNTVKLDTYLDPIDKQIFNFDVAQLDWPTYIRDYYVGARTYALKENPKNLPLALESAKRLRFTSRIVSFVTMLLAYYFFLNGSATEEALLDLFHHLTLTVGHQLQLLGGAFTKQLLKTT